MLITSYKNKIYENVHIFLLQSSINFGTYTFNWVVVAHISEVRSAIMFVLFVVQHKGAWKSFSQLKLCLEGLTQSIGHDGIIGRIFDKIKVTSNKSVKSPSHFFMMNFPY